MKEIPLTQGQFAVVDDDVYEVLMQHKWCAQKSKNTYYACRSTRQKGKSTTVFMHREVMMFYEGTSHLDVDHRNHDGLNNTRDNLHYATRRENLENMRTNTTGFPGVNFNKRVKRFVARAWIGKKRYHIGYFRFPEEAYQARVQFLQERCA